MGHDIGKRSRTSASRRPGARGAEKLATGPGVAYRNVKRAIRGSWERTLDEQLAAEAQLQGEAGRSRDFQEGVMAFLEKRVAKFEGR